MPRCSLLHPAAAYIPTYDRNQMHMVQRGYCSSTGPPGAALGRLEGLLRVLRGLAPPCCELLRPCDAIPSTCACSLYLPAHSAACPSAPTAD